LHEGLRHLNSGCQSAFVFVDKQDSADGMRADLRDRLFRDECSKRNSKEKGAGQTYRLIFHALCTIRTHRLRPPETCRIRDATWSQYSSVLK
jgi:hypothetical protein